MAAWQAPPNPIRISGTLIPSFVGRAAEMSAGEEAWAAVRAAGRQVLFIGGEPGAGKSRLAAEIAAAVYDQGAVVLLGNCSLVRGPYQPWAECLEQLLGGTEPGALADCLPDSAAELLRLTPLVWRHRPELSAPPGDGADYRRELFDAVATLLDAVGEQRPVVCVLEDLHWAGQPTLQLLDYVAQRSARSRLLLLCTHRTTAPDRSEDLTYAIADLYRLDGVRRLDLAGLSVEEVAQYLVAEGGVGARRAREYATVLRDQTGGNPFFLRELWRDLAGADALAGGMPTRAFGAHAPVSIRDTLQRRLSRLDPGERAVVETAAVLGDGGEVRVLISACTGDAATVLAALDAAVRFGLLDGEEVARGRIVFPHTLTKQAVLDLIEPSRLTALHARVGEVLRSSESRSPAVIRQLAYHFARAAALGHGGVAAGYVRLAAQEAERSLAFEDSAAWYVRAADLTEGPDAEREELWLAAADAYVRAGDFANARTRYLRLTDSRDPPVRLRAAIGYENATWPPGLPGTQARALLSHALEGVPEDLEDPWYVRALASLGRATAFTGDAERSRHLAGLALAQARRLGDRRLLRDVLCTMMWQHAGPESVGKHLALANELTPLARETQDWSALGTASVFRCAIAYIHADRAAWAAANADLDLAVRGSGQPFVAFMRRAGDYAQEFLDGNFAAAALVAEDLLERGRSFGPDDTEGTYGLQMYMIRRETGALEQVRPLLSAIRESSGTWEPGLLALYTELGLGQEAGELLWQLLDRIDETAAWQAPWAQWTAVVVFLVEAALALGDAAAARRLRPLLAPYSGQQLIAGQFVAVFGPADAYLAAIDSLLGDRDSAERLFAAALAQATGFGALIHRASVLTAWAAHLAANADPDDCGPAAPAARAARERLTEMRKEARRIATSTGQARLLRLLDHSDTASADTGPGDVAGLTPREIAVLRLLAAGSSNREIATRLKISENTAANHVRSILLKTGAANRTQVATLAVSRGWVADSLVR